MGLERSFRITGCHMKRRILASAAAALAACVPSAFAADCSSLYALAGFLGDWKGEGEQTVFEESWRVLGPATWEGRGTETPKAGGVASAEELRLVEMGGSVFYLAKVSHNDLPVAFRLVECEGGRFVFENPAHDFPRRLEYAFTADGGLTVHVSDGVSKGFALAFVRSAAAGGDEAAVLRSEDLRFAAMVSGDAEAMRRSFADDLAYVHSAGNVQGRDELVAAIAGGQLHYLALEPAERKVVFLSPDAAYVLGRAHIRAQAAERAVDFQGRYVAVYSRTGENWRLRAWQSLRLP